MTLEEDYQALDAAPIQFSEAYAENTSQRKAHCVTASKAMQLQLLWQSLKSLQT